VLSLYSMPLALFVALCLRGPSSSGPVSTSFRLRLGTTLTSDTGDIAEVEVDTADASERVNGDVVMVRLVEATQAWRDFLPLPPFLLPALGVSPSLLDRVGTFLPTLTVSTVARCNDVTFRDDIGTAGTPEAGTGAAGSSLFGSVIKVLFVRDDGRGMDV